MPVPVVNAVARTPFEELLVVCPVLLMKVVTVCAAAGAAKASMAMATSSERARPRNQQLLPAAPGESGEPVSGRAPLREARELPDGPGTA